MYLTISYIAYIVLSIALTFWVGRNLYKSGRPFLLKSLHQNEQLTDSINRLLIIGFYLINFGFVAKFLKSDQIPTNYAETLELLSVQIGTVLLTVGLMHIFNLILLWIIYSVSGRPTPNEQNPQ